MVRIANVMVNGEPVLEFNCRTIRDDLKQRVGTVQKDYLEDTDLNIRLAGFPREVQEAVRNGQDYVQLNPHNTFV